MGKLEEIGGAVAVDELAGVVPAAGHARRYAQIVRENALLRRLLKASYEIQESVLGHQAAPRELVEQAEKAMLEVARDDRQQDFRAIEEVLHEELDKLHRLSIEGTSLTGTPSGFNDLDEITGGFQPGNLIIIAARPAMGKSALVCNIAENAAVEHNKPVALFSLEMAEAELAQRFVASQARIKGEELRKGRVAEQRWPKILKASQALAAAPLWVDDSSDVGMLEIRAKARRLHSQCEGGLGLIIIDYLQLMRTDSRYDSRVTAVGELSRGLKILARELGRAGDRALAAQPRGGDAPGQEPAALGPAREREPRAGLRPGDVHLPRRVLRRGLRAPRRGRPDHRQAPQRRRRQSHADLPEGVPEVHELRRRALRAVSAGASISRRPSGAADAGRARSASATAAASSSTRRATRPRDCGCRAGADRQAAHAGLEGRVPKRYRGVSFDRPPVPEIAARARAGAGGQALRARHRRQPRRGPRAVADGRRRHRQDDARDARLQGRARRRALGRDLLAAAAART